MLVPGLMRDRSGQGGHRSSTGQSPPGTHAVVVGTTTPRDEMVRHSILLCVVPLAWGSWSTSRACTPRSFRITVRRCRACSLTSRVVLRASDLWIARNSPSDSGIGSPLRNTVGSPSELRQIAGAVTATSRSTTTSPVPPSRCAIGVVLIRKTLVRVFLQQLLAFFPQGEGQPVELSRPAIAQDNILQANPLRDVGVVDAEGAVVVEAEYGIRRELSQPSV